MRLNCCVISTSINSRNFNFGVADVIKYALKEKS